MLLSLLFLSNSFLVGDSVYEELIRDNKRKEDELRILHGKFLFSYTYALFVFIYKSCNLKFLVLEPKQSKVGQFYNSQIQNLFLKD